MLLTKHPLRLRFFLVCLMALGSSFAISQDIELLIKSDPFKVSGSLAMGTAAFTSNNTDNLRSPFSYYAQGTVNFQLYHVKIPVVLSLRDSRLNLSGSFNRIGINPKYKWAQLFLGTNNFQFSPYTLSGQTVNGVGLELTPGIFKLTVIKGTIRNLVPQTTNINIESTLLPTYERKALGLQLGMRSQKGKIQLSLLKIKDDLVSENSVHDSLVAVIRPEENFVLGINTEATIANSFTFGMDLNASIFTNDLRSDTIQVPENLPGVASSFLQPTRSTRASFAGEAFAQLRVGAFLLGMKIKQINPNYKSLGLFYIQNDFRNFTINSRVSVAKNKLTLSGSYGIQSNNLDGLRSFTQNRNIYSLQVNYSSNKTFGISGSYSNYSQDQTSGIVAVADTLRYGQVSRNLSIVPRLTFMDEDKSQSISLSLVRFSFLDQSTFFEEPRNLTSNIYNLNYNIKWKSSGFGIRLGTNYNTTESFESTNSRYGGTLGLSKSFNKKTKISFNTTYNISSQENGDSGGVFQNRFSFRHTPKKRRTLSFNVSMVRRSYAIRDTRSRLRANLTYTISF